MREIKFRAWDSNQRVMMYDDDTAKHDVNYWDGVYLSTVGLINSRLSTDNDDYFYWMQYIGRKDKNGKEIYERDIVRILYTDWPSQPQESNGRYSMTLEKYKESISNRGFVIYKADRFCIQFNDDGYCGDICPGRHGEIEVIGNIYENKELLDG